MTTVVELEKTEVSVLRRKKFCTDEVYKMMEIGILPEESGWELINEEIIHVNKKNAFRRSRNT
jgi:hypothetical protein